MFEHVELDSRLGGLHVDAWAFEQRILRGSYLFGASILISVDYQPMLIPMFEVRFAQRNCGHMWGHPFAKTTLYESIYMQKYQDAFYV